MVEHLPYPVAKYKCIVLSGRMSPLPLTARLPRNADLGVVGGNSCVERIRIRSHDTDYERHRNPDGNIGSLRPSPNFGGHIQ